MATDTASLSTLSPSEIDTVLAANWTEQAKLQVQLLRYVADEQRVKDQIDKAVVRSGDAPSYLVRDRRSLAAAIDKLIQERSVLIVASAPYEAEYLQRRWSRYFLVTNSNGHVHRGMDCSTCYSTTEYSWLPELSGCDESVMIEEFGEKACTVCFPSAPANPAFHAPGRRDREAVAARDAEKAEKQAAKDAKAITAVDGSPLKVVTGHSPRDGRPYTETYRTKVAARNALSQAVQSFCWYGPTHPSDFQSQARQLIPALEAAGIDTAQVIERASKKAAKETAPFSFPA